MGTFLAQTLPKLSTVRRDGKTVFIGTLVTCTKDECKPSTLQGYLGHKKTPYHLEPPYSRVLGGCVFLYVRYPCRLRQSTWGVNLNSST